METDDVVRYGICKQNVVVTLLHSQVEPVAQTLLLGTLLRIVHQISNSSVAIQVCDWEQRSDIWKDTVWFCPIHGILPVDVVLWDYLPAIYSPIDRVKLIEHRDLCEYIKTIHIDTHVDVWHNSQPMKSIVRYIGPVDSMGPGVYLGVELLGEFKTCGTNNGIHGHTCYFMCPDNAGLFVHASKIIPPEEKIDVSLASKNAWNVIENESQDSIKDKNKCNDSKRGLSLNILKQQGDQSDIPNKKKSVSLKIDPHKRFSVNLDRNKPLPDDKIKLLWDWPQRNFTDPPQKSTNSLPKSETDKPNVKDRLKASIGAMNKKAVDLKTSRSIEPPASHQRRNLDQNKTTESTNMYTTTYGSDNTFPDRHTGEIIHSASILRKQPEEVDLVEILGGAWPPEAGDTITPVLNSNRSRNLEHEERQQNRGKVEKDVNVRRSEVNKTNKVHTEYGYVADRYDERGEVHSNSHRTRSDDAKMVELLAPKWQPVAADTAKEYERNKSGNPISHFVSTKKKLNRVSSGVNTAHCDIGPTKKIYNDPPPPTTKIFPSATNTAPLYDTPERQQSPSKNEKCAVNNNVNHVDAYGLGLGSLVEVTTDVSEPLHGVIRWISAYTPRVAGIELEEEQTHLPIDLTDGVYNNHRYFTCAPGKGLFVPIEQCHVDQRFLDLEVQNERSEAVNGDDVDPTMFGQVECPVIAGSVAPLSMQTAAQVEEMCGKFRGIQGHHNSCYLDATLFAMFACTGVFDSLLFRPQSRHDIERYDEVQRVLREEIVNPLRQNLYVRADRVMKLRTLLEQLSSVTGLTSEEKDPEEFLNSLLAQILRAEPFLKLSSGQEAFYYQLFVEKDERLTLPSVQQLFEQSFLASKIKLKEVPSCLIIQMPRFGKSYKMYPRIIPSQVLDVTDIIEDSPRQCTVCGNLADFECLQCFDPCGEGLEGTAFCAPCRDRTHTDNPGRATHRPTALHVPADFRIMAEHCPTPPRLYMELFAVVCIETSHYVAFVKCGSGQDAPWCFFDSMADRKGEQNGYNIPEIVACPGLASWLGDDAGALPPRAPQLPEPARRLLCDAYLCLYQSSDVMMYR